MPFLHQLNGFDAGSLGFIQRVLVATDGTLTDMLQAIFEEPIAVRKIDVSTGPASEPLHSLDLKAGDPVMRRQVLLYGETTGRPYVYADSALAVNRLPELFRTALLDSAQPLGRLWCDHRIETLKELLSVERRAVSSVASWFRSDDASDLLIRSYRLISGGSPLMLITEYFPAAYANTNLAQAGV